MGYPTEKSNQDKGSMNKDCDPCALLYEPFIPITKILFLKFWTLQETRFCRVIPNNQQHQKWGSIPIHNISIIFGSKTYTYLFLSIGRAQASCPHNRKPSCGRHDFAWQSKRIAGKPFLEKETDVGNVKVCQGPNFLRIGHFRIQVPPGIFLECLLTPYTNNPPPWALCRPCNFAATILIC